MKSTVKELSKTQMLVTVELDKTEVSKAKERALKQLQPEVSAPGFRKGKAPLAVVEKQTDDNFLKSQALDEALNNAFGAVIKEHALRPIGPPRVDLKSYVPYTELTAEFTMTVVPPISLPDYKNLKVTRDNVGVTPDEVSEVLGNLAKRLSDKAAVERGAKLGDEVTFDFEGTDKKGESVAGASGKDYPLVLGSKSFIPGYEEELIGLKTGESKTFDIRFPKDYAHKPLANQVVTFNVEVKKVEEVKLPEINDDLAAKVGPFKSLKDLEADIEQQLHHQKKQEASAQYRDKLIEAVASKTKFELPVQLVEDQIESQLLDLKQNLIYRGITLEEFLKQANTDEAAYRENELKPMAERRVRAGLVLSEIADQEKIDVTPEELEIRMQLMKGQYASDTAMQQELDTHEARQNVVSQLMTEKTLARLEEFAKEG